MANDILIRNINWLDKEALEAEVSFELEGKHFWAFCHPCDMKEGEKANAKFSAIVENVSSEVFLSENKMRRRDMVPSENKRLRYYCYGNILSIHPVVVDCGVSLSIGDFLNDEQIVGSFVYFVAARLDVESEIS